MSTDQEWRDGLLKAIDENRRLRDQFLGTIMLLAFDGCISEGRARELAQINIYDWRKEMARILSIVDTTTPTTPETAEGE